MSRLRRVQTIPSSERSNTARAAVSERERPARVPHRATRYRKTDSRFSSGEYISTTPELERGRVERPVELVRAGSLDRDPLPFRAERHREHVRPAHDRGGQPRGSRRAEGHGVGVLVEEVADLADVALGQDAPVVHEQHPPRHGLDLVEDVARDHHRPALPAELAHEVDHPPAVHRVHPAHRLVEQQHLGVVGDRLGQLHPLAHALAVAADLPVLRVEELHLVERVLRPRGGTRPRRSR